MKKRFLRFAIATAFCLSITTANGSDSPAGRSATFWGGVDYRDFGETEFNFGSDKLTQSHDWMSAQLGVDALVADNLLAGVAVSWGQANSELVRTGDFAGSNISDTNLTSIHPYLSWSAPDGRVDWWATVDKGKWDVVTDDAYYDYLGTQRIYLSKSILDYSQRTTRVGLSWLFQSRNDTEWRLKSEARHTRQELRYSRPGPPFTLKYENHQVRLALEVKSSGFTLAGTQLQPFMRVGFFNYGGNREFDGTNVEIDGLLRYRSTKHGVTVDSRAWAGDGISGDSGDDKQWGIDATLRVARADWQGLSFSLTSGYGGLTNIYSHGIWRDGDSSLPDRNPHAWVYVRIAYGLTPHPVWTDCPRLRAGC